MAVYFKITCNDGDPKIRVYSEERLLKEINRDLLEGYQPEFVTQELLEKQSDPNYWVEGAVLIIKGEVAVPQEKQKVTEWIFEKE